MRGGGIEPDKRFDGPIEGFNPTLRPHTGCGGSCLPATPSSSPPKAIRGPGAQGKNRRVVRKGFAVDDAMVEDFKQFAIGRKVVIDEASWTKDKDSSAR